MRKKSIKTVAFVKSRLSLMFYVLLLLISATHVAYADLHEYSQSLITSEAPADVSSPLLASTPRDVEPTPPVPGDWTLTFDEEFESYFLDPSKWRLGSHYLGIKKSMAGTNSNNVAIQNGNLELRAEKTPVVFGSKSFAYSSGEISTFRTFRQTYGYFEAKIKYDVLPGVWPAFWLNPDRGNYGNENVSHQSFLRFNLEGLPGGVSKAILKLKVTDIANTSGATTQNEPLYNVSIHQLLSNDWTENDITWLTKPAYNPVWLKQFSGGAISEDIANEIIVGEDLVIDVTDYINNQILTNSHAGFAIIDSFEKNNQVSFGSKESSIETDRPRLEIDGYDIYPTDDAFVRSGYHVATNFGDQVTLAVRDPYKFNSYNYDGGTEIDIFESQGVWEGALQHAMHWKEHRGGLRHSVHSEHIPVTPTADGYHTYGIYWEPGRLTFYIDGVVTDTFDNEKVPNVGVYLLLSHNLGGWDSGWVNGQHLEGFDNRIISDDLLPATMYVDYVRAWSGTRSN